jgi:hypothetical protein
MYLNGLTIAQRSLHCAALRVMPRPRSFTLTVFQKATSLPSAAKSKDWCTEYKATTS